MVIIFTNCHFVIFYNCSYNYYQQSDQYKIESKREQIIRRQAVRDESPTDIIYTMSKCRAIQWVIMSIIIGNYVNAKVGQSLVE